MEEPNSEEIESVWEKFWKNILIDDNNQIDVKQLKKELYDYHFILDNVSKVYCEVTGDRLSYPNYSSDIVIREYNNNMDRVLEEYTQESIENFEEWIDRVDQNKLITYLRKSKISKLL